MGRWLLWFNPVLFLCFIVCKLLMLGRLTSSATRSQEQGEGRDQRKSGGAATRVYLVIAAAVVLCSVGGMLAFDIAMTYHVQIVGLSDQAAAACDAQGNDTNSSLALIHEAVLHLPSTSNQQLSHLFNMSLKPLRCCSSRTLAGRCSGARKCQRRRDALYTERD